MVLFVFHSFRPELPLLDLRLFRNRNLTVSIITMFLFAAAFFGGLLLVPTYFNRYDLIVTTDGDPEFVRQYAGHIENGEPSNSDPKMAQQTPERRIRHRGS